MAGTSTDEKNLFAFERTPKAAQSIRTRAQALEAARTLRVRLGLELEADPALDKLLESYAMDVLLVIAWYDDAANKKEIAYRSQRWGIAIIGCLLLCGTAAVALLSTQGVAVSIAVAVGLAIGALQVLTGGSDVKAQWLTFWKASADLKESLYVFLNKWGAGEAKAKSADFQAALWQAILDARGIVKEERSSYFATYRSISDIVDTVAGAVEVVRARGAEALEARKTTETEAGAPAVSAAKRVADLRSLLLEANAATRAAQLRVEKTEKSASASAEDKAAAATALIAAEVEVERLTVLIQALTH